ncbi:hypothetical protein TNCT_104961 [Trichonephila clavata]|uniref:Uncharacterized protein n=1 Tax=Trichonephila clavata TaxID=2740835 RepID=A0A8X6F963_TRICU|nr:hypothetical protein TNCT_104961 [Trichonephila clavata]
MASGKLNAQYKRHRGTGRPSKTSRSLLNVGDHLPITTKTRQQYPQSINQSIRLLCSTNLCTNSSVVSRIRLLLCWVSMKIEKIQSLKDEGSSSNYLNVLRIFLKWSKH